MRKKSTKLEGVPDVAVQRVVRRFRHIQGFSDSTDYIEVNDSGTYIVKTNGKRNKAVGCYSVKTCESFCRDGLWVEIAPNEKSSNVPTKT
jgi:hypothetical protein